MKKEVLYPAARAAITGLFAFVLAAVLWSWSVAALVGAGVAMAAWLVMQLPDKKIVERVGEPKVYPTMSKPLKISIQYNDGQAGLFSEFAIHRDQFIAWCIGADQGLSLIHI